jgi:flagellar basal-body rod protein FlgB
VGLIDGTQLVIEQAMAGAAARQQVLANNIANADTPDFHRSDLDFHSQLAAAVDADSKEQLMSIQYQPAADTESPVQANGNNVNIDGEMANMSQNALDYETLVEVANARLKMISTAIGSVSA